MKPTRRTQPYRGGGPKGPTRAAMQRGRPTYMRHPSTAKRGLQKRKKRKNALYRYFRGVR